MEVKAKNGLIRNEENLRAFRFENQRQGYCGERPDFGDSLLRGSRSPEK